MIHCRCRKDAVPVPVPGKKSCQKCLDRTIERTAKRKMTSLCTACGVNAPEPDKQRCQKCRDYDRAFRAKRTVAGLCACGRQPEPEYKTCRACLDQISVQGKERRDSLRKQGICNYCGISALLAHKKACAACASKNRKKKAEQHYMRLYQEQDGRCAVCDIQKPPLGGRLRSPNAVLNLDHNHSTGEARGLLCSICNQTLGVFKEDPSIIERVANRLIAYITRWSADAIT